MSLLSWNYRGLGSPSAVPILRDVVRTYHVDIFFLCETLVQSNRIEDIHFQLGFDSCFVVNSNGRSGGLALFWKKPYDCHLISYSSNFIDVQIHQPGQLIWRLTGFYGYPERDRRRDSWNLLRSLATDSILPWCIFGDFNVLLSNDEKTGLVDHPTWLL